MKKPDYILKQWHENLWTAETPFKLMGIEFGNRMTVIRSAKQLLLHSPVKYSTSLASEIAALGDITHLISPNNMHHLHVEGWREAYPDAIVIAPAKQKKLSANCVFNGLVEEELAQKWLNTLKIIPIQGMPKLSEYAFIHLPSKTLVLTDLAFNIYEPLNTLSKIVFKAYGAYQRFGPTRLIQLLVQSPDQFQQSLLEIYQYDFDRIIVSHGRVVESHGKDAYKEAFQGFLDEQLIT